MSGPEGDPHLSEPAYERLGHVLASVSFLRDDIHQMIMRLADGETRMDRQDILIATQGEQILSLRRDLSVAARALPTSDEPANSWIRLGSALSAVAKEWNEALRLWGRILRWLMLAYLAFTLNSGDRLGLAKAILMYDQGASEDSER